MDITHITMMSLHIEENWLQINVLIALMALFG